MSRKGKTTKTTSKSHEHDDSAVEALFNTLCDPEDNDIIAMEGVGKLCEMLGVDPTVDVRGLVLMWKLGAVSKPGQITKEEFSKGMKGLNVSDTKELQAHLPSFDPGFLEKSEFRGKTYFVDRSIDRSFDPFFLSYSLTFSSFLYSHRLLSICFSIFT
jgi:hypothetical protein